MNSVDLYLGCVITFLQGKVTKPFHVISLIFKNFNYEIFCLFTGAVGLLVISSSVTLAVPFCMGKVIDIINTSAKDGTIMEKLTSFCSVLLVIFLIGGLANFGRVYLMQISGKFQYLFIHNFFPWFKN